ncbi:glycyl-tRNA synthetase [Archaeoglobus sulfaticallidus PM70-1]|uniref:Glycine--tRNA ligase n=1 Tax=Archaeoglobus sulfaticallidus PM70-1 TaxID=387631 RepID=N0BEK9_9EURY|nr:glycine--tRNA ligase [Archaeoglobus sulfaticallidus]AGK62054.1 glycyl-tRNA synthetase [Archaeoglobus sulfaticallidus PM70-1]
MSEITEMLIRRGFLWQSFEIYGGMAGFFDYGPLGNNTRRAIENLWRKYFVVNERAVEIDTPTIGIEEVFIASGHAESFTDVAIECENCGKIFRADHYIKEKLGIEADETIESVMEILSEYDLKCECGGDFKSPENFNLMFSTTIGPGRGKKGYLRPETAQGMFINFKRLADYFRNKLPFGVCQIGRAYRNEISPRQGVIRLREFNQAELEYFVHPKEKKHPDFDKYRNFTVTLVDKFDQEHNITLGEAVERGIIAHELLAYFIGKTADFLLKAGIDEKRMRFRQHKDDEKAHYAVDCWDAEAYTSYGWIEIVGIADRGDYDLSRHRRYSKEDLSVFVYYDEPVKVKVRRLIPNMKKLGPVFREKTKKIAEMIEKYEGEVGDSIVLNVDGEEMRIDSSFFDFEEKEELIHGERVVPNVIEPSFGLDRITYAILEHAFDTDVVDGETRRVLRLKRWIAPVQVAVLPLLSREPFTSKAEELTAKLKEAGIFTEKDDSGSIGRRYRRYDEIGTPFCVTIDHQTFEDSTITIRDRDTTKQIRVEVEKLVDVLKELLSSERDISEFGEIFKE